MLVVEVQSKNGSIRKEPQRMAVHDDRSTGDGSKKDVSTGIRVHTIGVQKDEQMQSAAKVHN